VQGINLGLGTCLGRSPDHHPSSVFETPPPEHPLKSFRTEEWPKGGSEHQVLGLLGIWAWQCQGLPTPTLKARPIQVSQTQQPVKLEITKVGT